MSVNPVSEEIKRRMPKLATSLVLASAFWLISVIIAPILGSVNQQSGFLVGFATLFMAGIFLVRALFNAVQIGDKTVRLFLRGFGIKERKARERVLKDSICIIAAILCSAAISPLLNNLGSVGSSVQTITTLIVLGVVLLFVYDIGRVLHRIVEEKADSLSEWLIESHNEDTR
ncbi:MAG: hypothetical protein PVF15_10435 [Candidatus Bathyarchaeota archaeon]|jgi:archaellum biogenesis protein FlaJ (TadC family)